MPVSTILIVDDNPVDISFLRYALEAIGSTAELISAADSDSAFHYLQNHAVPDLLVLDFFLGKEMGLDLLQQLNSDLDGQVPVLLLSGLVPPTLEEQAQAQGVACLEKPTSFEGWCDLAQCMAHPQAFARAVACAA